MSEIIITMLPSHSSSVYFKRSTLYHLVIILHYPIYLKTTITEDLKCIVCHLSGYQFTVIFLWFILSVWGDTFNTIFSILISTKKSNLKLFSLVFLHIQFTVQDYTFQYSVFALLNSFIDYLQAWIEHISCSDNSICRNYSGHWTGEKEAAT